jgi:hypothetical protein
LHRKYFKFWHNTDSIEQLQLRYVFRGGNSCVKKAIAARLKVSLAEVSRVEKVWSLNCETI